MVPIIDRTNYTALLIKNHKIDSFYGLLFDVSTKQEVQKDFHRLVESIKLRNKKAFHGIYESLSQREPSAEAPFVNDNYLLFLLILGCQLYNVKTVWIAKVLEKRNSTNEESKLISTTFKNIIEGNYNSKSNDIGIIISLENLLGVEYTSWEERRSFYQGLVKKVFPFYSDDLLNLTSLKAYDSILLEGDKGRHSTYNNLLNFEARFVKRIKLCSILLQWMVILLVIVVFIYSYYQSSWFKNLVKDNAPFTSLLGIGGMAASFFFKGGLKVIIERTLFMMFGYNKKRN